ncbi:hypothetical protein PILCRDRAFT_819670 [Piloderma croceum F 1598]|uniref:Uncharacterized protein n=1 Tax=Piloderma croceum (strain F 1598) TaxID=765440 RepID=A0A0C3FG79_PILCF|nr:hypothetical protein PILCRDRAFT_819670 [Piloderma croceum F 1598]
MLNPTSMRAPHIAVINSTGITPIHSAQPGFSVSPHGNLRDVVLIVQNMRATGVEARCIEPPIAQRGMYQGDAVIAKGLKANE